MTVETFETTTRYLILERSYPAAAHVLYGTLLDPGRVCEWCALPGESCRVLRWDPEEGGAFEILVRQRTTGEVRSIVGDFVALEPPRRIIATFQPETPERHPDTPRLCVDLIPEVHQTRLRLMHARLTGPDAVESAAEAWQTRLERIEETIPLRERLPAAPI